MKTLLVLLFTFSVVSPVSAAEVICSLNVGDTRYKLIMDEDVSYDDEVLSFMVTASSISATRQGQQSQRPVGTQDFLLNGSDENEETDETQESDEYVLDTPIKGTSYSRDGFDFTQVTFSEKGDEDLAIKIEGPALTAPILFTNCLTAE